MNLLEAEPNTARFTDTMRYFLEESIVADVFLRSYPMNFELPKNLREKTRCVRIIQVSEGRLTVGSMKPLVSAVIPMEDVAAVAISSESMRPDEEEIDRKSVPGGKKLRCEDSVKKG